MATDEKLRVTDELTIERWQRMPDVERDAAAGALVRRLPQGFTFRRLTTHELSATRHTVAEFDFRGSTFVLIPGGRVTLGFDADRPWKPTETEAESWAGTAEEYGIEESIHEHIVAVTLRPREVELRPYLIEAEAHEVGWEAIASDSPEVRAIRDKHGRNRRGPYQVEVCYGGESSVRVRWSADGSVASQRRVKDLSYESIARTLAAGGFRFPTSDEWEYACGAGAATLFRWGDHAPCDRYPFDTRKFQPGGEYDIDWNLYRRPNAFGIRIAENPYHYELTAEANLTRGGDGGCMICGGAGYFVGWLTLATAYFEEEMCRPQEPVSPGYTVARRVLPIDQ
jgi:formylglycine-generating enzyme required for sulfatase activity